MVDISTVYDSNNRGWVRAASASSPSRPSFVPEYALPPRPNNNAECARVFGQRSQDNAEEEETSTTDEDEGANQKGKTRRQECDASATTTVESKTRQVNADDLKMTTSGDAAEDEKKKEQKKETIVRWYVTTLSVDDEDKVPMMSYSNVKQPPSMDNKKKREVKKLAAQRIEDAWQKRVPMFVLPPGQTVLLRNPVDGSPLPQMMAYDVLRMRHSLLTREEIQVPVPSSDVETGLDDSDLATLDSKALQSQSLGDCLPPLWKSVPEALERWHKTQTPFLLRLEPGSLLWRKFSQAFERTAQGDDGGRPARLLPLGGQGMLRRLLGSDFALTDPENQHEMDEADSMLGVSPRRVSALGRARRGLTAKARPTHRIVNIFLMCNGWLYRSYILRKLEMQDRGKKLSSFSLPTQLVDERRLFHGTTWTALQSILKEGFLPQLARDGCVHGQGTYFALSASYCDRNGYAAGRGGAATLPATALAPMGATPVVVLPQQQQQQQEEEDDEEWTTNDQKDNATVTATMSPLVATTEAPQPLLPQPIYPDFKGNLVQSRGVFDSGRRRALFDSGGGDDPVPTTDTCTTLPARPRKSASRRQGRIPKYNNTMQMVNNVNHKIVIVSRVLVGRMGAGRGDMRIGEVHHGERFDTAVDSVSDPSIFCIFDGSKALPEAVIEYTTDDADASSSCSYGYTVSPLPCPLPLQRQPVQISKTPGRVFNGL